MNKVMIVAVVLGVLTISGCSTIQGFFTAGAKANDEVVKAAEFALCNGASVGSIRRHYGNKEQAVIWRALCANGEEFTPETE